MCCAGGARARRAQHCYALTAVDHTVELDALESAHHLIDQIPATARALAS